ncbi:MAG: hypothetical protein HY393_00895 [Candidatus Diapherotrites archaeon]|nr:hypothetical protein [Candidatus Diapherotrites archaeon]
MSVYGPRLPVPKLDISKVPLKTLGKGLGVLVVLLLVAWMAYTLFTTPVLRASFSRNPLNVSLEPQTLLEVQVSNPTQSPAVNVIIEGKAISPRFISMYPQRHALAQLGPNETRTVYFLVHPLNRENDPLLGGEYGLLVRAYLNGESFDAKTMLKIKTSA